MARGDLNETKRSKPQEAPLLRKGRGGGGLPRAGVMRRTYLAGVVRGGAKLDALDSHDWMDELSALFLPCQPPHPHPSQAGGLLVFFNEPFA